MSSTLSPCFGQAVIDCPPSTEMACPVTNDARGDSSHAANSATSSGFPRRSTGTKIALKVHSGIAGLLNRRVVVSARAAHIDTDISGALFHCLGFGDADCLGGAS